MPENDPRQIDVNLSIGENQEITAFTQAVQELQQTISASGGLPTGHVSPATAGGPSRPPPPQQAQTQWEGMKSRYARQDIEGIETGEVSAAPPRPGGPSRPGAGGPELTGWQKRMPEYETLDPIAMPRFGEFTAQDTLNMMQNITGSAAYRGPDNLLGSSRPGIDPQTGEQMQGSMARNVLGTASAAFGTAAQYAPYAARAQQMLGINVAPQQLQTQGQALGLQRTQGADITIPGTGIGAQIPGSQYFGQAGGTMLSQNINALQAGLQPGISTLESQEFQGALNQLGWTDQDVVNPLNDMYTRLKSSGTTTPSAEISASIADQSVRYGNTSIDQLEQTFKNMDKAAQGANMSLDEFAQGVDAAGNELQGRGLSYNEGVNAVKNLSAVTNMPPGAVTQMMDSPFWQAQALGQTGLLPEAQGLIAQQPGTFNDVTRGAVMPLMKAYEGAFQPTQGKPITDASGQVIGQEPGTSAYRQALAQTAGQVGMSPEQLNKFLKTSKVQEKQSNIMSAADSYARGLDKYGVGGIAPGNQQNVSWVELKSMMGQHGTKMSPEFIKSLQDMNPEDRKEAIKAKIADLRPKSLDPNKTMFDLTPRAARVLQEAGLGGKKGQENRGETPKNEGSGNVGRYGMNMDLPSINIPNPVNAIPDKFNPF